MRKICSDNRAQLTVEQRGPTRRQCYSLPRNCVVPTLTMQELTAAKAGRLMSV
jgi:hypothetical protein